MKKKKIEKDKNEQEKDIEIFIHMVCFDMSYLISLKTILVLTFVIQCFLYIVPQ